MRRLATLALLLALAACTGTFELRPPILLAITLDDGGPEIALIRDNFATEVAGTTIVECGLCGERFGDRAALARAADQEEAAQHGYDPAVWPVVRALLRLPGIAVGQAEALAASSEAPRIVITVMMPVATTVARVFFSSQESQAGSG